MGSFVENIDNLYGDYIFLDPDIFQFFPELWDDYLPKLFPEILAPNIDFAPPERTFPNRTFLFGSFGSRSDLHWGSFGLISWCALIAGNFVSHDNIL